MKSAKGSTWNLQKGIPFLLFLEQAGKNHWYGRSWILSNKIHHSGALLACVSQGAVQRHARLVVQSVQVKATSQKLVHKNLHHLVQSTSHSFPTRPILPVTCTPANNRDKLLSC